MYDTIKNQIYSKLLENKDKTTAILWSGGPYSTLLWFIAYNDLSLKLPVIFIDTGDLPPALYAHVAKMRTAYKLDLTIISGKIEEVIPAQKNRYEILYSGKDIEGATNIIPDSPETWNYLKSLPMPFYGGVKRSMLG
jgi:3'-phosphoadenosine 5'-phosphosulfate sulfotransferase (PAPS reductase)/FAD synthetase